jgi:phage gp36-like protein
VRFCEQANLERALGGADVLAELLDKNQDGAADADQVAEVLDEGSGELASYLQVNIDIATLRPPYPSILVLKAADVCAFWAWVRGSEGQAAPANIVSAREIAIQWAVDAGKRRAGLGVVPKPGLDPPAKMVDPDPMGMGISRKGFARGFR